MTNTQATIPTLVTTGTRFATALAVAAAVSAAWLAAGHESREAVHASAAAMGPKAMYVTLPTVEIAGQRVKAEATDLAASPVAARPAL